MELWDVYDIDRMKKDKVLPRGAEFAEGDYHLVIHVCIFNKKGEMLIQQRQSFKNGWPNLWDISVGGSAVAGENSRMAAEREVWEELGLKISLKGIRPHLSISYNKGFDDYYLLEQEVETDRLTLQYEEVQQAKWASREEILSMLDSGEFIPYYRHLICLLFDMRRDYGAHATH